MMHMVAARPDVAQQAQSSAAPADERARAAPAVASEQGMVVRQTLPKIKQSATSTLHDVRQSSDKVCTRLPILALACVPSLAAHPPPDSRASGRSSREEGRARDEGQCRAWAAA